MTKMFCWASSAGGCVRQSREHFATKGIWQSTTVTIQGLPWCREPREVALDSIAAKILCAKHNNAFSPLDEEASKWYRSWRDIESLNSVRADLDRAGKRLWNPVSLTVNGDFLERWVLKTLISTTSAYGTPEDPEPRFWTPTHRLVSLALGSGSWGEKEGLYFPAYVGAPLQPAEQLSCCPVLEAPANELVAGSISIRGIPFVLSLREGGPTETDLAFLDAPIPAMFHIRQLSYKLGRYTSAKLKFRWSSR